MTAEELVATLRERSITVSEEGGALLVAPASWLTPEETEFVNANAAEMIAALRAPKPEEAPDTLIVEPEAAGRSSRRKGAAW